MSFAVLGLTFLALTHILLTIKVHVESIMSVECVHYVSIHSLACMATNELIKQFHNVYTKKHSTSVLKGYSILCLSMRIFFSYLFSFWHIAHFVLSLDRSVKSVIKLQCVLIYYEAY